MTYSIYYAAQLIDNATGKVLEEKVVVSQIFSTAEKPYGRTYPGRNYPANA